MWHGRNHGGKGIGCCVEALRLGDQPLSKGEEQPNQCDVSFGQFVDLFHRVPLPRDNEQKDKFDIGVNLLLGDPIPLRFQDVPAYETPDTVWVG